MIYELKVTGSVYQIHEYFLPSVYNAQELLATKLLMGGVNLKLVQASTEVTTDLTTQTMTAITKFTIPNSQFKKV